MNASDELAGEIRRALTEIGDAAGLPPTFDELHGWHVGSTRSRGGWALAAAAVAALLLVGAVAASRGDHRTGVVPSERSTASVPEPSMAVPVSVEGSTTLPWSGEVEDAFVAAVQQMSVLAGNALPPSFEVIYVSAFPLQAVAYDRNGVRLTVSVGIGLADEVRHEDYRPEEWHQVANGEASADERTILTEAGDVVSTAVGYGPNVTGLPITAAAEEAAPSVTADVAARLDQATRARLLGARVSRSPAMASARLAAAVSDALVQETGAAVTVSGGRSAGEIHSAVQLQEGTWIDVTAFYTKALKPAIVRPDDRTATAITVINGWQVIVSTVGAEGTPPPLSDEELDELLAAVEPAFRAWAPVTVSVASCSTHTIVAGDSTLGLAGRYGITVDELIAADPDMATHMQLGAELRLPCGATEQLRSNDLSGLDGFSAKDGKNSGFELRNSLTIASDTRVWIVSAGTDTGQGLTAMLLVTVLDRSTGAELDATPLSLTVDGPAGCTGPLELVDDPSAPLDAIPFRCVADGSVATLDLFSGQTTDFDR